MMKLLSMFLPESEALNMLHEDIRSAKHTPDRLIVESQENVLLFEYGDLKRGMPGHSLMCGQFKGIGYTDTRFYMWNRRDGAKSYPIVGRLPGPHMARDRVQGEVFLIPSSHLYNIDNHRQNGVLFTRERMKIKLQSTDAEGNLEALWAYVYIAKVEAWKQPIEFDLSYFRGREGAEYVPGRQDFSRNHNQREVGRYYTFTRKGLEERNLRYKPYFTRGFEERRRKDEADKRLLNGENDAKIKSYSEIVRRTDYSDNPVYRVYGSGIDFHTGLNDYTPTRNQQQAGKE